LAGKAVRDPPVLASYTGVSLAVQVEIKLPTWTGLHWTAATLVQLQLQKFKERFDTVLPYSTAKSAHNYCT
jgi:hypothetical protein